LHCSATTCKAPAPVVCYAGKVVFSLINLLLLPLLIKQSLRLWGLYIGPVAVQWTTETQQRFEAVTTTETDGITYCNQEDTFVESLKTSPREATDHEQSSDVACG
jgi:hypothetical protein